MEETLYFCYIECLEGGRVVWVAQATISPQSHSERDSIIRELGMGTPISKKAVKDLLEEGAHNENVDVSKL